MNINQFSDIPLISSQQFELNDNQLSILDDDFFQKLLQLTEKQQWLSDNNNHVNATNLKDNELEQKERMESEELFILFSMHSISKRIYSKIGNRMLNQKINQYMKLNYY